VVSGEANVDGEPLLNQPKCQLLEQPTNLVCWFQILDDTQSAETAGHRLLINSIFDISCELVKV
jgi:hypothetical protein